MTHHTHLDDNIWGDDNFRTWKCRISLILEGNYLDWYISKEVPDRDEAKAIHKNNLVKAKMIIADSIKVHLIPHVSSLKIDKDVFDALKKLFEGNNMNRKLTLRNQLNNVNIYNLESM